MSNYGITSLNIIFVMQCYMEHYYHVSLGNIL